MSKRVYRIRSAMALLLALVLVLQISPGRSFAFGESTTEQGFEVSDVTDLMEDTETDDEENTETEPGEMLPVYENGVILIYSEEQLRFVGSDRNLTDDDATPEKIGTGKVVTDGEKTVVYGNDSTYKIAADFEITDWQWPDNFDGEFVTDKTSKDRPVYDAETDTVFVYHPYQLKVMAMDNRDIQTVLDGDAYKDTFGMGKPVLDNDGNVLTYSADHKYVISSEFSHARVSMAVRAIKAAPALLGAKGPTDPLGGRDFPGQVVIEIEGKKYILIGNEDQLNAIGTDTEVFSAVYQTRLEGVHYNVENDSNGNPILLYPGDADLDSSQNGYKTFAFQTIDEKKPKTSISSGITYYAGVNQTTGETFDSASGTSLNQTITSGNGWKTGEKYSTSSNYIIFRDIDLNYSQWTPRMYTGIMYGIDVGESDNHRNATIRSLLSDSNYENLTDEDKADIRPHIKNVNVNQNSPIDVAEYEGVGFFATVTNKTNTANIGVAGDRAIVRNIELYNVTVNNNTSEVEINQTIVNGLLSGLGTGLGWLVDGLLTVLSIGSIQMDLQHTLSNLLNARAEDPSVKATGAFAGRLQGDVLVEDCVVTGDDISNGGDGVRVSNINDRTGGFVGYSIGLTEYSGLSQVLGGVVDVLSAVLNVIPVLGLGDLVTILLGNNALPLGQLIPTGYKAPTINRCEVSQLNGTVGSDTTQFNGGFIGHQVGTKINDSVVKDSEYTVNASNYGGGFCGNMRDAEIKGTLDGVGVDLSESVLNALKDEVDNIHPQSVTQRSKIENSIYSVSGGNMLGGFCGVQNSGVIVDDSIDCPDNDLVVSGTGNMVGGFSGYATVGWLSSLGEDENNENSLLGTVRQLATSLLSTDQSTGQRLLSLMGLAPSTILGSYGTGDDYCPTIDCRTINVHADGNFAGGLLGKGDGVYIGKSDAEAFENINNWDGENLGINASGNPIVIQYLESVSAENYAGGVVGYDGSAAFQGLLNGVAGLGDFIGFDAHHITVNGVAQGYTVTANHYNAGGAFGLAVGGTAEDMTLNKVRHVEATNRAAGFVGVAGPGELIGTGALTVNLLGLDRLLSVQNLLSAGQGLEVHITDCVVNGIEEGLTVKANGGESEVYEYTAAGFIADSNSTKIVNSHTHKLLSVTAPDRYGYAGGFVGTSETGGLAEVANNDDTSVKRLLEADGLVKAIGYLIPSYTNCTVHFLRINGTDPDTGEDTLTTPGFVQGDVAGGFVADMESGTVDNSSRGEGDYFAVYDIDAVKGQTFGGGFGAKVVSGALANAGGGLSILGSTDASINVGNLLSVVQAYIPYVKYAGVSSINGFTVEAKEVRTTGGELNTGCAGGFIGYGSGAQVTHCDVMKLKHTDVTPPDNLESILAPSYFDEAQSAYAVRGGRYAGGYIGNMDIGSAASLGGGLKILKDLLNISNVASALSVVVSTIEHSKVEGKPGGFAVLATGDDTYGKVGKAGGFAGEISGGHIQNSHAILFSYIIGEEMAGGYVGNYRPGDVAKLLDNLSASNEDSILAMLLKNIVDVNSGLATLISSFVPTIRNSTTTCIPCGGAVRAQAASDNQIQRGCAGGYCGHNEGGSIWGFDNHTWQMQNDGVGRIFGRVTENLSVGSYTGPYNECKADRIHSVYGFEYAGGFTGFMEPASTAETGNIKLLGGLIRADNLLSALNVVYPTEENTAVYGPLRNVDVATWNAWVKYVGSKGSYAFDFIDYSAIDPDATDSQEELDAYLAKYIYGTNVVAGREYDAKKNDKTLISEGGDAGGYVGYMVSGTVTNGQAYDTKFVSAMRSAGGFVGKMRTGGAAEFGGVSLLGLELEVGSLIKAAQVFVPVIKNSSVHGFLDGMKVYSKSEDFIYGCGNAGGYAGSVYGGQIWGDAEAPDTYPDCFPEGYVYPSGCDVTNLRYVQAKNNAGGYVGLATAAAVADVNTTAGTGFLQSALDTLFKKSSGNLASVLEATVTTIRNAHVSASEQEWGFVVEGTGGVHPRFAGGFVGYSEASVIGDDEGATDISVSDIRYVDGQFYAGGFVGLADVGGVADVAADDGSGGETSILELIRLGNTSVLDVFRTYIYYATVTGVPEGLIVRSYSADSMGILLEERFSGCAGGFGGGIMNGTVKNSGVTNLNTVLGINYTGGFVGHLGKSGVADVDNARITGLLGLTAGVLDVFGSHVEDCTLSGIEKGIVVRSMKGEEAGEQISGGFVGYADISRVKNSTVTDLKQVKSDSIAGGFVGKTDMHYLVEAGVDSALVRIILEVVNILVKALYLDKAENIDILDLQNISGFDAIANVFDLHLLSQGDVLFVNLFGLRIGVSLLKDTGGEGKDTAVIRLGDSTIELPCTQEGGVDSQGRDQEIQINLIKGNRTKVENCKVTGINIGYDVYGGGADNDKDGTDANGYTGGFVGLNHEGEVSSDEMIYCDVVRGTAGITGHFTGQTDLESVYSFNTLDSIESGDKYHVYRVTTATTAEHRSGTQVATAVEDTGTGITYQRFDMDHRAEPIVDFADWEDATMGGSTPIKVYESAAKAVLMRDIPTNDNGETMVPEPAQRNDPCDEVIDFTVQKIWDDMYNLDGVRPETITIILYQTGVLADGTEYIAKHQYDDPLTPEDEGTITMTKADDSRFMSATWTHVITGLPAAEKVFDHERNEEIVVYYRYSADEIEPEGYTRVIEDRESDRIETIRNVHRSPLPFTGGNGLDIFVLGIMLITASYIVYLRIKLEEGYKRKPKRNSS